MNEAEYLHRRIQDILNILSQRRLKENYRQNQNEALRFYLAQVKNTLPHEMQKKD